MPRVIRSLDGNIAVVSLHNPKAGNALTRPIYEQLCAAWEWVDATPEVRVVVFTAAGERHFCVGADMSALTEQGTLRVPGEQWKLTWRLAGVKKPVVVAINGTAAGGGLGFVTDGDVVIAARHARFLDTHTAVGQVCGYGALRMVSIIGPSEATRVAIGGGVLSAERAHELGLVNELADTAPEALARALEIAGAIANASPTAVAETLGLVRALSRSAENDETLRRADRVVDAHMRHPDASEGPRAWLDKRPAVWV
ncbi:enoyl-CoA hydratase/isomerase family protein [Mycobacterium sp. CVI_P3]|uniref:Enoyl-CoA hydratase/isomerase family protein n=1 Tax=Mycobacterium pinniadriaticum TaxID=2994102 RepID=A0ABT3SF52_9MYCO|nr:enoyl-CoA hydratase/isomerase family protein [Mycobacterium pinniadriaticum]MCX2931802.1 enoyl-CoA hydratase/isomerase family protein [Mycobacterium pinniadriaticum]MCX2938123.1 enoyl-CoA hydratase/isomerase family protein [Mycobacterium pinniadriaticum]